MLCLQAVGPGLPWSSRDRMNIQSAAAPQLAIAWLLLVRGDHMARSRPPRSQFSLNASTEDQATATADPWVALSNENSSVRWNLPYRTSGWQPSANLLVKDMLRQCWRGRGDGVGGWTLSDRPRMAGLSRASTTGSRWVGSHIGGSPRMVICCKTSRQVSNHGPTALLVRWLAPPSPRSCGAGDRSTVEEMRGRWLPSTPVPQKSNPQWTFRVVSSLVMPELLTEVGHEDATPGSGEIHGVSRRPRDEAN